MTDTATALILHDKIQLAGTSTLAIFREQAREIVQSGMMPDKFKKNPASMIVTMLYGREMGLQPMESLKEIHVINGVPGISANLMNKRVRQRLPNAFLDIEVSTDKECRIAFRRTPEHTKTVTTFTIKEAEEAGLTKKDVWQKYAKDLLFARCFARMVRQNCPDVVDGFVHTAEELESIPLKVEAEVIATGDAEVRSEKAEPATVEATVMPQAVEGDKVDEDAAMDFIALLTDCKNEEEVENAYKAFSDYWSEKSPATAAEAYDAYCNRLKRLKDAKGTNAS